MMRKMTDIIFFWGAWIILPLLFEIIPAIGNFFILLWKRIWIGVRGVKELDFKPVITIIIPVYNSDNTLYRCIQSVSESTYPADLIEILLVDNGSRDKSFDEFQRAQLDFPKLGMWWIASKQGKSKALNKAIFNSNGKYIINIDSDGILHKDAIYNMVRRFELSKNTDCMTGVILTEPELIDKTPGFLLRQFRKLEFMEYAQAFLAGRNFESQFNSVYTLSGAFSAFRKSVLLKTYLYNTNTICEDTHLTFQIKSVLKKKVFLCPDALFLVDPIDNINKFYTQRQRWQIGELEVTNMFMKDKMKRPISGFFTDPMKRLIMMDHTFAFPRLIWYFALMALGCLNYNFTNIIVAVVLVYLLYVFSALLYYLNIVSFLKDFGDIRKYYGKKVLYLFLLPIYSMFTFFVRLAGIINSIKRKSSWKTMTMTEEKEMCEETVNSDWDWVFAVRNGMKKLLEIQEEKENAV